MAEKYGWECYRAETPEEAGKADVFCINRGRERYCYKTGESEYVLDSIYENGQPVFEARKVSRFVLGLLYGYAVENGYKRQSCLPVLPEWREAQENPLSKELIRKGMRCELTEEQIGNICQKTPFEKDDYYDFGAIVRAISMYRSGEISPSYFQSWCILMQCLYYSPGRVSDEVAGIYGELAWMFDGEAFNILGATPREREESARGLLAMVRWSDFRIGELKRRKKSGRLFGKKDRYLFLLEDYYNGGASAGVWRVFYLDKKNKRFDLFYCDDLLFDDGQEYMFPEEEEFENLTSVYFDYRLDRSIGERFLREQARLRTEIGV